MTYLLPIIEQDIATAEALLSESRVFFQELLIKAAIKFRNPGEPSTPEGYQWDFPAVHATLEALRDTALSDIDQVIGHLKRLRAQAGCSNESWLIGQLLAQRNKLAGVNPTVGARRSYLEAMNFGVLELFLDALCTPRKATASTTTDHTTGSTHPPTETTHVL